MSISKGNELLQVLYARLKGLWYNEGAYAGQPFPQSEVKELLDNIAKEYDDEVYSREQTAGESESENVLR